MENISGVVMVVFGHRCAFLFHDVQEGGHAGGRVEVVVAIETNEGGEISMGDGVPGDSVFFIGFCKR